VAFSADGAKVLTGSYDDTANLWDAATGACIHTFDGYPSFSSVNSVAFSPDGSAVLTGRSNNTAQMWNAVTGAELHTFAGDTQYFRSAIFSPDGTRVLTGAGDNAVNVWDAATGTEIRSFAGHMGGPVSVAAFSPDGTKVLTGASIYDSNARLWDTATGTLIHVLRGHTWGVWSVAFSPDGSRAATAGGDDAARLWDTAGGTCLRLFSSGRSENCAAFSPDGTKVLTGSGDSKARVWDAASGQLLRTFEGHTAQVSRAVFFPDGTRIITVAGGEPGYTDCSAKVWDVASGAVLSTLVGGYPVSSLSFFPDGTKIILGFAYGGGPLLIDASTYEITNFVPGHTHQATSAVLSPDGTKVLFREVWPDKVLLWNVATGTELRDFVGHTDGVGSVAFSPDGTKVLTAGLDSTAKLWPVVGGIVDVIVPDVMGQTEAAAATALAGANLTVGRAAQHCSDVVMPGMVISQNPGAGHPAAPGSTVCLTVSTGPCDGHVVFTNPPQCLRRYLGETAQFSVTTLGGIGALHYQWWFDNGQKTRTAVGSDAPILTLSGLTLANSGTYSCDVTDQVPATYSSPTVVLEVRERIGMPVLGAAGVTALAVLMALGGSSMARRMRRLGNR
jgi:WD40 repeat protein